MAKLEDVRRLVEDHVRPLFEGSYIRIWMGPLNAIITQIVTPPEEDELTEDLNLLLPDNNPEHKIQISPPPDIASHFERATYKEFYASGASCYLHEVGARAENLIAADAFDFLFGIEMGTTVRRRLKTGGYVSTTETKLLNKRGRKPGSKKKLDKEALEREHDLAVRRLFALMNAYCDECQKRGERRPKRKNVRALAEFARRRSAKFPGLSASTIQRIVDSTQVKIENLFDVLLAQRASR